MISWGYHKRDPGLKLNRPILHTYSYSMCPTTFSTILNSLTWVTFSHMCGERNRNRNRAHACVRGAILKPEKNKDTPEYLRTMYYGVRSTTDTSWQYNSTCVSYLYRCLEQLLEVWFSKFGVVNCAHSISDTIVWQKHLQKSID